jgi:hypothetical protein
MTAQQEFNAGFQSPTSMPDDAASKIVSGVTKELFGIPDELQNCYTKSGQMGPRLTDVANKLKNENIVSTIKAVKELASILRDLELTKCGGS